MNKPNLILHRTGNGKVSRLKIASGKVSTASVTRFISGQPVYVGVPHDVALETFPAFSKPVVIFSKEGLQENPDYGLNKSFSELVDENYYGNVIVVESALLPENTKILFTV